jgi:hypothetical protein
MVQKQAMRWRLTREPMHNRGELLLEGMTERLTVLQLPQIRRLARTATFILLSAGGVIAQEDKPFFSSGDGFVLASGSWKLTVGQPGDDIGEHAVEIQCSLEIRLCHEAMARVSKGKPVAGLSSYKVLQWNKNGIIGEDDSAICTINRLLVSFEERSVTALATPKKGAKGLPLESGKDACQLVNRTRSFVLVKAP